MRALARLALVLGFAAAAVGVPVYEHICAGGTASVSLFAPCGGCRTPSERHDDHPAGRHADDPAPGDGCCASDRGGGRCDDRLYFGSADLDLAVGESATLSLAQCPSAPTGPVVYPAPRLPVAWVDARRHSRGPPGSPSPTGVPSARERRARLQVYRC